MRKLIRQSVDLDIAMLRLNAFPESKAKFLVRKYAALLGLAHGTKTQLHIGPYKIAIAGIDNLGTVQSSIVDFGTQIHGASILAAAPHIVDVGANIGQFCLAAKLFYPGSTIICIEADTRTAEVLASNVGALPGVSVIQAGVDSYNGVRTWFRHELSAMSSFVPYGDYPYTAVDRVDLEVHTLDDLISSGDGIIDLIKIDVEGLESEVLRGATDTLQRSHYLLVEIGLSRSDDGSANLGLMSWIAHEFPGARLLSTGRLLGNPEAPTCVDVLIDLHPDWDHI